MKGICHESKRVYCITFEAVLARCHTEEEERFLPTTSSSRKNAESMARRIIILLDLEIPIFLAAAVVGARGAQQALMESSDGEERCIDEQKLLRGLRTAFSGFSGGSTSVAAGGLSVFLSDDTSWCEVVALFSNISFSGPCVFIFSQPIVVLIAKS
jgi:hypothetical protein